jgi:hypothetical protein
MVRSTDFNIREALKRNRQLLTGAQESGRTALAGYEELAPQYNRAVEQARNYQGTLTRDYNRYVQDRQEAVASYKQELQRRKTAYETAAGSIAAQGPSIEQNFQQAQQKLQDLQTQQDTAEKELQRRYQIYADNYQTVVRIGARDYEQMLKSAQGNPAEYQKLVADTGYVQRFAEQQTATILKRYQDYQSNTYNPAAQAFSEFKSGGYRQAEQALLNLRQNANSAEPLLQDYQAFAQDTGYVDRAASDTKAVYDASQQEYSRLQAAYEGMAPQLSEYTRQAKTAKQQVLTLAGQAPGLQRSLAIDTEARKRGDRLGYRRSVLSQGFKRRGAAR